MYLAPLNYDRYFKKVFSDLKIAKRFLEDFLDVEIQEITAMPVKHKVTDAARFVEFDFRCKIDNNYVIVDMQQWYKHDVVYRFYTYHSVNTAIQLENLPDKETFISGKLTKIKDYSKIEPVITIIWMVDDNLGFSDDFVSYVMLPHKAKEFFEKTRIWDSENIESKVREIVTLMQNNTKGLQFLQKNPLIFAFQKNIVRNKKFVKYATWFSLAEKTLNRLNEKSDFNDYQKDKTLVEVMRRLLNENLSDEDFDYIKNRDQSEENIKRYDDAKRKEGVEQGIEQGIEQGLEQGIEQGIEQGMLKAVEKSILAGLTNEVIKIISDLSDKAIDEIRKKLKKKTFS